MCFSKPTAYQASQALPKDQRGGSLLAPRGAVGERGPGVPPILLFPLLPPGEPLPETGLSH